MSDMDGYLDPDERCVRHGLPHPCGDCALEQHADGWRELQPQDTTDAVRQAFAALLARIEKTKGAA